MRTFLLTLPLTLVLAGATLPLLGQTQRTAPANEWRQFRGTAHLAGVSAAAPPATLELLWTYDAGEVIDSSAAIVDGVVYVGGGDGDLIALDLDSGTLRWKYTTGNLIGESSPAVGPDTVYIGDLGGIVHAVSTSDGAQRWTFQTGSEIKSSPVLVNDIVLIGSYDGHLYALDASTGAVRWKVLTMGQVHATPAVQDGLAFIAGCDAIFRAIRVTDGTEMYQIESGAYTGASPVVDGDRAYFGTFNSEVLALDLTNRTVTWRYARDDARFPYYSSAALDGERVILGGRDKVVHAIDAATGETRMDVRHAGSGRLVTRRRRRPCVHRIRRRPALRARCRVRDEDLGIRHRRRHHRIPCSGRRQGRHRCPGRAPLRVRVDVSGRRFG